MGKLEKTFYWLCFVLAIYITIGFKLVPVILKDQLVKNLDENLTQKTDIGKVEFNPFTFKVVLHDFKLSDSNNIPTISFSEFSINFAFLKSIDKAAICFKDILLKDAFVNIIEEKDGSINLAKLVKPSPAEDKKEETSSSSNIEFLVSKLVLENANIKYSNQDEKPYSLNLENINYILYDLGTYKNILSSNDLELKLNEHTNISVVGAFNLVPFRAYGKITIDDLRVKELLAYKENFFNFDLNEEANLNLILNYNVDTTENLELQLRSEKLELNKINLKQNKISIANLEKLDIKKFTFDLQKQDINLDDIDFDSLKATMISDKNGINFANLIKETKNTDEVKKQEEPTTKTQEVSKPWNVNLSNIKVNNSDFSFLDKVNNSTAKTKAFNISLDKLKIVNSDVNLNNLLLKTPTLSYNDNKNNMFISTKNTNINLDNLAFKDSILDINKIEITKEKLTLNDKKSNFDLDSNKLNLLVNKLKIANNKTSIDNMSLKSSTLGFDDNTSKMQIDGSNINVNVNAFLLDNETISIKAIKLDKPSIKMSDKADNIELNAKDIQLQVNNLINNKDGLSINSIRLIEPNLDFLNTSDKTKIEAKNLDLEIKKLSNSKKGFKIENTNLNKPNISVILAKKDSQKDSQKETTKSVEKPKDTTKTTVVSKKDRTEKSSRTRIEIGPMNITNAIFTFEDKNLPLPFKTTVTKLNGKISEFRNRRSSTSNLEVKGVVDEYGVAKITGLVHPNNIKILTDINLIFNNIAIKNFTPYSGKFVGREIKDGKLDLDLKYNIEKSNLEAKNNIVITKLELGDKVESPDAISLPLDIAITLLKDSNGVIDINLPVSGNVDDPQFAIGSILWRAFVNLMTKAVTAPFSLLGALFNFSPDEIKTVRFTPLEDEVGPIQKETLDKIAQILKSKSEIAIKLTPSYNNNDEIYALKKEKYLAKKQDDRHLKNEEIEALISKENVKISELEKIAKIRVSNINAYLIKEKAISSKQIIIETKIENNSSSIILDISKIK